MISSNAIAETKCTKQCPKLVKVSHYLIFSQKKSLFMNDQTSGVIKVTDVSEKISFEQYGKESAASSKADPKTLEASLATIYNQFLKDTKLDSEGIKLRVTKLEAEVLQKKDAKENAKTALESLGFQKEAKDKKIEELEIERINMKEEGAPTGDTIPFVISTFIVILLTCYLFVFYSSTGYSALFGLKNNAKVTAAIINPETFSDAAAKGGGVLVAIILFPVIFLGLGFLIHDALEKKKYGVISILLFFTLIVDAIMGYKITEALHNIQLNKAEVSEQWQAKMVFSDVNFYLILMLGFVVYIIWGALLNYTLTKYNEMQPKKALELMLENLDRKIEEQRNDLLEMMSKISNSKGQIASLDNEIEQKTKDAIGYKNGVIPVDISKLRSIVGQFMQGWFGYISFMFKNEENKIKELTIISAETQKVWLDNKINNLEQEA
jgi:hypothetical protein